MDRSCKPFQDGLATLAEGRPSPETTAHLETCPDCAARLAQLTKLVAAARQPRQDAPADLIARAQALMAGPRRLVARLLGSSLATAGTRRAKAESFSVHLGAEEFSVRLQYTPVRDRWEVAGRAPAEGWSWVRDGDATACGPSGRFRFTVDSLEDSAFTLRTPAIEIAVPAAPELLGLAS